MLFSLSDSFVPLQDRVFILEKEFKQEAGLNHGYNVS